MNANSAPRIMKAMIMGLIVLMTACSPLAVPSASGESSPTALPTLQPTATPVELGSISGWVWHDECVIFEGEGGSPDNLNPGCIEDAGGVHADGLKTADEQPIRGVRVSLGVGACPSIGLAEVITVATDLS